MNSGQLKSAFNALPSQDEVAAYFKATKEGSYPDVLEFLDRYRASVDITDGSWTGLMFAAHRGHKDIVELLLDRGADIDKEGGYGYTVLRNIQLYSRAPEKDEIIAFLEQWPETQKQRLEAEQALEHARWLEETDCSKGLKQDMSVRRPIKHRSPLC